MVTAAPVFISYASEDLDDATRLRTALEASDIPCWMAPRDIEPGTSFPAAVRAALISCRAVVLLLTNSSNNSPHVLSEIEQAFNERKPILPVLVAGIVPSDNLRYFISTSQWFDAEGKFDDDDVARVRTHLQKLLAGERVRISREKTRSRVVWGASAALGLVALAAGIYMVRSRTVSSSPPTGVTSRETPAVIPEAANESATKKTRVNPRDGQTYVWVPPGVFTMGCSAGDSRCESDELPTHMVRVNNGFWLGRTEVTIAQYATKHREIGQAGIPQDGDSPIAGVTWHEAKAYCESVAARLPTEAEWEYAARAGTTTSYYDTLESIAWYGENSEERSHPVGTKAPNAFGLHDMLGNVYEWVLDRYYNEYDESNDEKVEEPILPNAFAAARGGAWTSEAHDVRVSNRLGLFPDMTEGNVGFRCASSED